MCDCTQFFSAVIELAAKNSPAVECWSEIQDFFPLTNSKLRLPQIPERITSQFVRDWKSDWKGRRKFSRVSDNRRRRKRFRRLYDFSRIAVIMLRLFCTTLSFVGASHSPWREKVHFLSCQRTFARLALDPEPWSDTKTLLLGKVEKLNIKISNLHHDGNGNRGWEAEVKWRRKKNIEVDFWIFWYCSVAKRGEGLNMSTWKRKERRCDALTMMPHDDVGWESARCVRTLGRVF